MALIGLRGGGEHGNLIGWAATTAALTRDTSTILTGMGGPASIKHDGSVTGVNRFVFAGGPATTEYATVYFSFKFMMPSIAAPASTTTWRWMLTNNGNLNVGGIRLVHSATTGLFELAALNGLLASAGTPVSGAFFTAGQTHVISGKFIAGATGSIEINVDGVNVIPTTTIATTGSHPAGTAGGFTLSPVVTTTRVCHFGDFIFDDAAYPPQNTTVIARQFKAGTPTYDGFVLVGGGSKHANISETPPSATLAVASPGTAAQAIQTCLINSFSTTETGKGSGVIASGDNLLGVRPEAYCKASTGNLGHTRLRLGGVDTDAQVQNVTASDNLRWGVPKTGVLLTDLNAGEAGFVKPDSTPNARTYTLEDMWVLAAYAPGITGTLAATETGPDTAAFSVNADISGTLSATETGLDSAAFTASVQVSGSLVVVEVGADSAAFLASISCTGQLAATEVGADQASFVASSSLIGSLAAVEVGPDIASVAGTVTVTGTLAAGETGADTATLAGSVTISGSLAASEVGSDQAALAVNAAIAAALAASESGADAGVFSGTVAVSAVLAAQEVGSDTCFINLGVPTNNAVLAATETGPDTLSASLGAIITGALSGAEQGPDTASVSLQAPANAVLGATETGPDTAAIALEQQATIQATIAALEIGSDLATISIGVESVATLAAFEVGSDTADFVADLFPTLNAALAATESGPDTAFVDLVTKPPKQVRFVPLTHRWSNHMATDRPVPMTQRAPPTPAHIAEMYRRWGNRMPPNYTTDMAPFTPFRRRL